MDDRAEADRRTRETMKGQVRMLRCRLAGVQAVEAQARHVFARHSHEHYGIGLIHHGAHRSSSSRGMVEAGAGDIITVNPGEVHDGAPIGDAGRSWRMLYFDPAVRGPPPPTSARTTSATTSSPGRRSGNPSRRPVRAPVRRPDRRQRRRAGTMRRGCCSISSAPSPTSAAGATRAVRPRGHPPGRGLIDDDPAAPVTLADLAHVSGLSRFQVLRGFAAATGLTPHAYLVQRRIDLARRLIGRGTRLADAAAASGFADQSHMTRLFVRAYGLAPGAYAAATA